MGGGIMQLVAYGAQDVYLTGNPQITFFKVVYRRHTNFSMETIKQNISGQSFIGIDKINNKATVIISRNGDLITSVYVSTKATQVTELGNIIGICGDNLIEDVEIEIGGQRIDKHYKEWNQIWDELSTPASKSPGYKYMTGSFNNNVITGVETKQERIHYPLKFWFCRNPGLALPLIALQYHEVQLKFTWGVGLYDSNKDDHLTRSSVSLENPHDVEVWADYVYLDTDERRRFSQVSHEYLIEQLQIQKEKDVSSASFKLNLEHPIKELIWTTPTNTPLTDQKIKLSINGHDRFYERTKEYFTLEQPYKYHTSIPGYNIKETEHPVLLNESIFSQEYTYDSTQVDVSALSVGGGFINKQITDRTSASSGLNSVNYKTFTFVSADASSHPSMEFKRGDIVSVIYTTSSLDVVGSRNLTVLDVFKSETLLTDKTIYEITFNDSVYAPATPEIQTTNDKVSFEIIARVQNPVSRCSQLKKDIYVYSFSLEPEEHQPSGSCNFSRIDSAKLLITPEGAISNIYAVNYNVLRIISGMGGLAYSS